MNILGFVKKHISKKNQVIKTILSVLAVPVFGFILWKITFMLDYLFQTALRLIVNIFNPMNLMRDVYWVPQLFHLLFAGLIILISWFVFRSRLSTLMKAIYMTVPLAVVFVTIGIFFYPWPWAIYSIGFLTSVSIIYYFYSTKQPWLYYYTVVYVGLALSIFSLMGGEI